MNIEKVVIDELKLELAKTLTGLTEQQVYNVASDLVNTGWTSLSQFDKEVEKWILSFVKVSIPYVAEFLYALLLQIAKQEGWLK